MELCNRKGGNLTISDIYELYLLLFILDFDMFTKQNKKKSFFNIKNPFCEVYLSSLITI